jgi:hypothetical protein
MAAARPINAAQKSHRVPRPAIFQTRVYRATASVNSLRRALFYLLCWPVLGGQRLLSRAALRFPRLASESPSQRLQFLGELRAGAPSCQPEAPLSLDMQVYCV